ncbi:MAG: hypothetical protein NTZ61_14680, partial [Proteobacteria bacterium]|nr:hypothetical protein [Pseudomonadota bacterium]
MLSAAPPAAFGFLSAGTDAGTSLSVTGATLAVPAGETLSFVGRDRVALTGAKLKAPGGRVNLAAVNSAGDVDMAPASAPEPLDTSGFSSLGDIDLAASKVNVGGETPGSVYVRGGRLVVEQGSKVLAENAGAGPGPSGRISLDASESLVVDDGLLSVSTSSAGDAGTIELKGGDIEIRKGPGFVRDFSFDKHDPKYAKKIDDPANLPHATQKGVRAETSSSGAGGAIQIDARSLTVTDGASVSTRTFTAPEAPDATGDAGRIDIAADSVTVSNRSDVSAGAWGSQGDGGAIRIHAGARLDVDATDGYALLWANSKSPRDTFVGLPGPDNESVPGTPGTIEIRAGSVKLLNGALIQSGCAHCSAKREDRAAGASNVHITAEKMVVAGGNERDHNPSFVYVGTDGEGDAGDLSITVTGSLDLMEGAALVSDSEEAVARGNAGTITLDTGTLSMSGRALINAGTASVGDGGTIGLITGVLSMSGGAQINAGSVGSGDAGTVRVAARESISLSDDGGKPFSLLGILTRAINPTSIFSSTTSVGNGGSITLVAPEIRVTDGALVATSSVGGGNAGDISLRGDHIRIANGGVVDSTSFEYPGTMAPGGGAGNVTLEASERIDVIGSRLGKNASVSSATGAGKPGTATLEAPLIVVDGGAVATTALPSPSGVEGTAGGNITITAGDLVVRGGGRIDASSF